MMRIKIVINKKRGNIDVYVYGLEKVFETLRKHGFEQGDEEDGVLTWFWYLEDVDVEKLVNDLKRTAGAENVEVEYEEEQ
jgi:ribonucleotide monophosphatase NagD (HAD superfamily)